MTPEEVETFSRCIAVGGAALFPSDTVYGLATEPDSKEGIQRLYVLKGRPPDRPAAVMFFDLELALAALPELGERTRARREAAPSPVRPRSCWRTPPAAIRSPAARKPERLGLRVPALEGALGPLAAARWPVPAVQRKPLGRRRSTPDRRCGGSIRAGVDLLIDAGARYRGWPRRWWTSPATRRSGEHEIVREGALEAAAVAAALKH